MNKPHLISALCAGLLLLGLGSTTHSALLGVLPATPGSTDWQAYYDDQLDITWTANANINGANTWDNQMIWAAGLDINGVTSWRLPNMDVNGDGTIVGCWYNQAACKDNEIGHLYFYGAGASFGNGITPSNPGPFSNIQNGYYWSGTEFSTDPAYAWSFLTQNGAQWAGSKNGFPLFAWAVADGNVGVVPVPAAVWLFGSGLLSLLCLSRHRSGSFALLNCIRISCATWSY